VSDKRLLGNCGKGKSNLVGTGSDSYQPSGRHDGKAEV